MKVILILGTGHCGSTLLDMLLGAHSQITGVGEIQQLDKNVRCTCGENPSECTFWRSVVGGMDKPLRIARSKFDFLFGRDNFYYCKTGGSVDSKRFILRNEQIYRNILDNTGAEVVVDSSKSVYRASLLACSDDIDLTIVHLVRDGRAVTWSYYKKYGKAFWFMFRWFAYNLKVNMFELRHSMPIIFMRYEKLARKPKQFLHEILDCVGLEFENKMLDFRKAEHHQVGGNRMRFRNEGIEVDDEWKREMPMYQRLIFNSLFGAYNFLQK